MKKICQEGRLFPGDKERSAFEGMLDAKFFKKRPPVNFSDLPKESPLIHLINTRLANFDHANNFFLTMVPYMSDFYFNSYLPRESAMFKMFYGDKKGLKETLYRWMHTTLNQISTDKERTVASEMEAVFKQTMYEFIQAKKALTITPADINRILDGTHKGSPGNDYRAKFFRYACEVVDSQIQKKFEKFNQDLNKDIYTHEDPRVVEARKIAQTSPLDLMVQNLWMKVAEWGLAGPLNREVAKTFVPKEKSVGILEFDSMVVFDVKGFEGFKKVLPPDFDEEKIMDLFDVVDFQKLLQIASDPDVKKKDAVAGLYIQSIKPPVLREAIVERVVNSPQRCRYYVLRRPKSFFEKNVAGGGDWLAFIEKNMLTTTPVVHEK